MVALCASLVLTPLVRRMCERYGGLDEPRDERRIHSTAIPRLGGVAVFLALIIALAALFFIDNLVTQSLSANRWQLFVAFTPAVLVFVLGIVDDLRGVAPHLKLSTQGLAAALFYALGGRIEILSVPYVGPVELSGLLGFVITVFWVVAITNAFNLIDGVDGLAAGAALFASFVMIAVSIVVGHPFVTVTALALSGALIGFLRYNFSPASIFLGDSGALFIGFLLATLSVQGTQKASTAVAIAIPLLAFGVPVIDTTVTLTRRFLGKRPLLKADREHIHHMLLARGWSQRRVVLILYGVCALFGLQALLFIHVGWVGRITGLWLFVVGVAVLFAVDRLHYHEGDEIRAGLKRSLSFTERRLRVASNIRVRRASYALSQATTLRELFSAVQEMLELSDFVYASVQLGWGDLARQTALLEPEWSAKTLCADEMRLGCISWSWERGDIKAAEVISSSRFWSLRLSLSTERAQWGYIDLYRRIESETLRLDANYLCSFFQHQMALAAERVVGATERPVVVDELAALSVGAARSKVSGF
jgi:UDP-GlcNAc:undecaprenyl-phosphate GlcNAc-1-phosphate transferase